MRFDIVVAADTDLGIGKDGTIPWRLRDDMAHFRALTRRALGGTNALIMGRLTWESIPERFRPLSDRLNIVLTSNPDYELPEGVLRADSLDDGLAAAAGSDRIFIIGGGKLYAEALKRPECEHIYYTAVDRAFDCDTFFPSFGERFERTQILDRGVENDLGFQIELWSLRES